ncbi:MAG: glycoside hydrolase family 108 protein [Hyphomicrobium sp.]
MANTIQQNIAAAQHQFERALREVLKHEGGYVNHPKDPGGATNKGITQRVYDDYRKSIAASTRSVKFLTEGEIGYIYRAKYWNLIKGDTLPPGLNYVVFDGAVNSGCAQSAKWLQRALRPHYAGAVDGLIGPGTLQALREYPDLDKLIVDICAQRLAFMKSLRGWPTFGKGWSRRVSAVSATGRYWAIDAGKTDPEPATSVPTHSIVAMATEKADVADAKAAPSTAVGDVAVGAGTVAAVFSQTVEKLAVFQAIPGAGNAILYLTVGGAAVAVVGVLLRWWASRRAVRLASALA